MTAAKTVMMALREDLEALGLVADKNLVFRMWDADDEVCTVVEGREITLGDGGVTALDMGFVSRSISSMMMMMNIIHDAPRIAHAPNDLQFNAAHLAGHKAGRLPTRLDFEIREAITVFRQVVQQRFPSLVDRLRMLKGWPSYLHEAMSGRPGAQSRLLTLLVYVLLATDAPEGEVVAAFNQHCQLKEPIPFQIDRQRKMIREKFGSDVDAL